MFPLTLHREETLRMSVVLIQNYIMVFIENWAFSYKFFNFFNVTENNDVWKTIKDFYWRAFNWKVLCEWLLNFLLLLHVLSMFQNKHKL